MQLRKANDCLLGVLSLLLLSILLSGCPSTGVRPTGAPKADVTAAERLAREGKPREAAQMYESLAAQATGTQQTSFYLAAARQWMAAGAYPEAQRVLTLTAAAVTGKQATEHALLSAELALAEKNPQRTLEILRRLGTPTDPQDLASALAFQARAQFAMRLACNWSCVIPRSSATRLYRRYCNE